MSSLVAALTVDVVVAAVDKPPATFFFFMVLAANLANDSEMPGPLALPPGPCGPPLNTRRSMESVERPVVIAGLRQDGGFLPAGEARASIITLRYNWDLRKRL